jgi:hypothetical protein
MLRHDFLPFGELFVSMLGMRNLRFWKWQVVLKMEVVCAAWMLVSIFEEWFYSYMFS